MPQPPEQPPTSAGAGPGSASGEEDAADDDRTEPSEAVDEQLGDQPEPVGSTGIVARTQGLGPAARGLAAFLVFLTASVVVWAAPIITELGTRWIGRGATDSKLYQWSVAWIHWTIAHGVDPLYTDKVWAPRGTSLTWVTFIPGAGVLVYPVEAMIGRVAALNILMVLSVALSCLGGYLVCSRVTRAFWPSLVGGYLVGFSQYMAGQMHGHTNLVLIFPAPFAVYLVIRHVERSIGWIAFVGFMTLTLVTLFLFSTELFATTTVFGVVAFAIALIASRHEWRRVFATGLLTAGAYALSGLLLLPYLRDALTYEPDTGVRNLTHASVDLLSFIVPRDITLVSPGFADRWSNRFEAAGIEDAGYLSVALVAMLVLFALTERRRRGTWALLTFVVLVSVAALGPTLHVNGRPSIGMPWGLVSHVPLIQSATPDRFPAYTAIAVAVIAAIWLARAPARTGVLRWLLVLAAPVLLFPNIATIQHGLQTVPSFFATGEFRDVLRQDEIVFAIPTDTGDEMAWQAESDFWFRLVQGYVGPIPPEYAGVPLSRGLARNQRFPFVPDPVVFAQWLDTNEVSSVVMSDEARPRFEPLVRAADGMLAHDGGGVSVWRPAGGAWVSIDEARVDVRGRQFGGGDSVLTFLSAPLVKGTGRLALENEGAGGPALLMVFTADCGCRQDLELLERLHRERPDLRVFALLSSGTPVDARSLLSGPRLTYDVGYDPLGRTAVVTGVEDPRVVVVMDAGGAITARMRGPLTFDALLDAVSSAG
jgi:hypothetical protein